MQCAVALGSAVMLCVVLCSVGTNQAPADATFKSFCHGSDHFHHLRLVCQYGWVGADV